MIAAAWDRYRGWAKRARVLQATDHRDKTISLVAAAGAAVFGALATIQPEAVTLGRVLAFLAAASASVTAILGRELLAAGHEAKWVRARATAEAIKSECFLAAARAGGYSGPHAADRFEKQIAEFEQEALAAGIIPLADRAADDRRRPPEPDSPAPLTVEHYRDIRLQEQLDYYRRGQNRHETAAGRLRSLSIIAAVAAALLGIAAGAGQAALTPWIGAVTTIGAAVAAWGLMDRRTFLAASYGAMAYRLQVLDGHATSRTLPDLVVEAEELLRSEHTAWARRMSQPATPNAGPDGGMHPSAPTPPAGPPAAGETTLPPAAPRRGGR
jgi:hypothetical protein